MKRNIKIEAITLKKIQIGESNLGITLLTANDELIFVMAFGAAKSKNKLFSGCNPFVVSSWDLYFDPVKEYWRAKDAHVLSDNNKLHGSLENFYTASFFAEIILKTQGSDGVFELFKNSLIVLAENYERLLVLIQFILRLLLEQGLLPSFEYCSVCEKNMTKETLYYNGGEELLCKNCLRGGKITELNLGISIYCRKTPTMELRNSLKIGLEHKSLIQLKKFLIDLIKNYTGGKLLTLDSSNGLI